MSPRWYVHVITQKIITKIPRSDQRCHECAKTVSMYWKNSSQCIQVFTQKQPYYKKCGPVKNGQCKSCKIKGVAKILLWWYRLISKNLIITIQVNLCYPSSTRNNHKMHLKLVLKFLPSTYITPQPFLGHPFDFTTYINHFNGTTPFFYSKTAFH